MNYGPLLLRITALLLELLTYAVVQQLALIGYMQMCTVDTAGAYLYSEYPDYWLTANVAEACGLDPTIHYRIRYFFHTEYRTLAELTVKLNLHI
jgi:uncharacterized membrane protein YjdF